MPRDFTAAMRGAVLHGGKPISDFVTILTRQDRSNARHSGAPDTTGFRAQHSAARHKLCTAGASEPAVTWLQAGTLICNAAHRLLQTTPNICPETALRQTVHAVNKGTLNLQSARNGSIKLG